jgi:glycosyltransferase involved in cell wall biosynthesis
MLREIALVTLRSKPAPLAGAEKYVWCLSKGLAQRGHNITLLVSNTRRSWFNPLDRLRKTEVVDKVRIMRFENFYPASGLFRALRIFHVPNELVDILSRGPFMPGLYLHILRKSPAYDLVHASCFPLGYVWLAWLAARRASVPFVVSPFLHMGVPIFFSRYLRTVLRNSAAVIAATNSENDVIARMGVPSKRIHVIPAGIEVEEWTHASGNKFRKRFGIGSLDSVVLVPSTDYEKGAIHVLMALDLVAKHVKNIVLVTMGFPTGPWLKEKSKHKDLRIIDLGWVSEDEKKDVFDGCDILCQPSRGFEYGTVHLEAWMRNKPVIAAKSGPIQETIRNGTNGFLVEFGDVDGLARRILELIGNPTLRETMGSNGRELVLDRHDYRLISERIESVYESAVCSHAS